MKKLYIFISRNLGFKDISDLDKKLMDLASNAMKNSYSVYSNFSVGAALILENDHIIIGSNQENASILWDMC